MMYWTSPYRDPWTLGPYCTGTPQPRTPPSPPPRHWTSLFQDQPPPQASLDMFKLVQLKLHCIWLSPPPDMLKLVHYEAHTVGKRAVRIPPKCFLVTLKFSSIFAESLLLLLVFFSFVSSILVVSFCSGKVGNGRILYILYLLTFVTESR